MLWIALNPGNLIDIDYLIATIVNNVGTLLAMISMSSPSQGSLASLASLARRSSHHVTLALRKLSENHKSQVEYFIQSNHPFSSPSSAFTQQAATG